MTDISPYLRFNDKKCREAFTFYKECLGGELTFQTIGETPMAKEMPPEAQDKIMHATLTRGDSSLFGADMMRDKATVGDNISVALSCKDQKEIETIFAKLSKGGEVFMPVEKTFWGAMFGVVTDRYGVEWMLNFQMEPMKK